MGNCISYQTKGGIKYGKKETLSFVQCAYWKKRSNIIKPVIICVLHVQHFRYRKKGHFVKNALVLSNGMMSQFMSDVVEGGFNNFKATTSGPHHFCVHCYISPCRSILLACSIAKQ